MVVERCCARPVALPLDVVVDVLDPDARRLDLGFWAEVNRRRVWPCRIVGDLECARVVGGIAVTIENSPDLHGGELVLCIPGHREVH